MDQVKILGESEAFLNFQEQLSQAARVDRPVLILGERGTGKELAASRLHYLSKRWDEALVTLNCASMAPTLIEDELFGHERGAFTGAAGRRSGRFEAADGGTLFLDEIGTIPMEAQAKILRAVEYGVFERIGSSSSVSVDVRIVAATNVNLRCLTEEGRFKQDLLDRLSFEVLVVPPLRGRLEDIPLLANHFAAGMLRELDLDAVPEFSSEALEMLLEYDWPGNIRELKNVTERAICRGNSEYVGCEYIVFDPFRGIDLNRKEHCRPVPSKEAPKFSPKTDDLFSLPLKEARAELEKRMAESALKSCRHNQKHAAKKLGLSYDQFRGLYRKYFT